MPGRAGPSRAKRTTASLLRSPSPTPPGPYRNQRRFQPAWAVTRARTLRRGPRAGRQGPHPRTVPVLAVAGGPLAAQLLRRRSLRAPPHGSAAATQVKSSQVKLSQNSTGINAINYFSPTVFKSLGITGTSTGLLTTGIFGIIKTIGALAFILVLVETVGRRRLLMISSTGGAFAMYYIAAYISIAKPQLHQKSSLDGPGISALVFFYVWTIFYSFGWNPLPWVYGAEAFDNTARPVAQIFMAASNWLYNFVISQATPHMFAKMGYGVYLFFASCMVCSVAWIFFLMPETKGIPIEEMDNLHEKRPQRHAHRMVLKELRIKAAERRGEAVLGNADYQLSEDAASSVEKEDNNQVKIDTV